jgi:superfamily II RNA helicase
MDPEPEEPNSNSDTGMDVHSNEHNAGSGERPVLTRKDSSDEEDDDSNRSSPEPSTMDKTDEIDVLDFEDLLPDELAKLKLQAASKKRIRLRQDILKLGREELKEHIRVKSRALYGDEPKDGQVDAVAALVRNRHTFVLAGTGFGKTRIAEMFHDLFQPYQKSIVLVLNPLDTLGNNQVCNSNI